MSMPLNLTFLFIRLILIVSGLTNLVLGFFHGPDINLLSSSGLALLIVAAIPYKISTSKLNVLGIAVSLVALILNVSLITIIIKNLISSDPMEWSDIALLLPTLCLTYLLFHFSIKGKNRVKHHKS